MAGIKALARQTAVYGLSSIVGRFLNWGLVPLYVYLFPAEQYGIVSYLYSFTAVMLVILNYGMETGFFRFANSEPNADKVYTTAMTSVGLTSLLFIVAVTVLLRPVSVAMTLPSHEWYVWIMAFIVAIDAFTNVPFAYLRYRNRAWRFAAIKLINIGVNIGLNLFFILLCPVLERHFPSTVCWFYTPLGGQAFGIGWIFVANLLSSLTVLLLLVPEIIRKHWQFDSRLLRRMLTYSWPLLVLGVAGIMSQNMGQLTIPYLFAGHEDAARSMVGIYAANMKIAVVMVMFTQAFRYAYEPFIFSQARGRGQDNRKAYCDAMKYFVIFGLFIFLGVMYYLPILRHFISPAYWEGLRVVPLMMIAELCFGVFFNLSLWYKLTDRTRWGMWLSLICFVLMLGLNLWLVPLIGIPDGYMGSAWAALISYAAVMVLSYFLGRHYYPLPYEIGTMALYTLCAAVLYFVGMKLEWPGAMWVTYTVRALLLLLYLGAVVLRERLPLPRQLTKKRGAKG